MNFSFLLNVNKTLVAVYALYLEMRKKCKTLFWSNTRAKMLMVSESSNAFPMDCTVLIGIASFKQIKKCITNRFQRAKNRYCTLKILVIH